MGGAGDIPASDTADDFLDYEPFHAAATAAAAAVPANYLSNFTDLDGATQLSSYLTYKTMDTYSAQTCADFCDATSLCTSFRLRRQHLDSLEVPALQQLQCLRRHQEQEDRRYLLLALQHRCHCHHWLLLRWQVWPGQLRRRQLQRLRLQDLRQWIQVLSPVKTGVHWSIIALERAGS